MAKFEIPTKEKLWIQPNKGDLFGNIFASWNLDFDSAPGNVKVSPRAIIRTDDTDDGDIDLPLAFVRSSADTTDRWWALTANVVLKNTNTDPNGSAFVQDNSSPSGSPSNLTAASSDMVEFNGSIIVSDKNDLNKMTAGTWDYSWWDTTLAQSALVDSIAHPLCVAIKSNILMIGDGNSMHTVDKNNKVKVSRVILPTEFEITWIRSTYDGAWIGARSKLKREGKVFFWDEKSENFNRSYGVKNDISFACVIKGGIPYIVNGVGQLLKFTGVGFEEVAVFPCYGKRNQLLNDGQTPPMNVHRNGMSIIDDKIHINICSAINATVTTATEEFPSGVWVYDEKQGLRHKYGFSRFRVADFGSSHTDNGQHRIALAGALVATNQSDGVFLAGARILDTAGGDVTNGIWFSEEGILGLYNIGYLTTSAFESSVFEDVFQDILLSFKRFRNSGDRIIVKYRTDKSVYLPYRFTGTWVNTTTFTFTASSLPGVAVGDEIQIIFGVASGSTAHISQISNVGTTWTVVLDEALIGPTTTTFGFIINNWKKAAVVSTQGIDRQGFDLWANGTFIQLKIELRSASADTPELEKIVVNTQPEYSI